MATTVKGTRNLFRLLVCFAALGITAKEVFQDGKVTGGEIPVIFGSLLGQTPTIIKVAPEALAEAKNLTVPEVMQVVRDIKATPQFEELETPKVAGLIQFGFDVLQSFENLKGVFTGNTEKVLQGNVAAALSSLQKIS
jgi:hypothetical protein